jgi:DNA polymerase V
VCDLNALAPAVRDELFGRIAVGEVWGVGGRIAQRLDALGIRSVRDLQRASSKAIRGQFSVVLERTVAELNGVSCLALEEMAPAKQQIMCSRSFGRPVTTLDDLTEAVAAYATRAAEKLRQQHSVAGAMQVFIRTNPFKDAAPHYQKGITLAPPEPSDDTRVWVRLAVAGVRRLYRPGFEYQKAGVLLDGLRPAGLRQTSLFDEDEDRDRSRRLMATLDQVNRAMGRGTLRLLGEGLGQSWKTKASRLTPRYTTRIADLPIARAC